VKITRYFIHPADANVGGEKRVKGALKLIRLKTGRRSKMENLGQRMNTGIRSAGADDGDAFFCDFVQSAFENALDRFFIRLSLPAMVIRSIVTADGLECFHSLFLSQWDKCAKNQNL